MLLLAGPARAADNRPNLVLFCINNLRADRVGCYGYDRPTTPALDRVARGGTLFGNAFAQSTGTLPSFASIFTSLYPTAHHVGAGNRYLDASPTTLASIFAANGYRTAAFVGGGHLHHLFGLQRGFDTYRDEAMFGSFCDTIPPALQWLDRPQAPGPEARRPFFLVVQGYDVHCPWTPPLGFAERFDPLYSGPVHTAGLLSNLDTVGWLGNRVRAGPLEPERMGKLVARYQAPLIPSVQAAGAGASPAATAPVEPGVAGELQLSAADVAHLGAHYDGALSYADAWLDHFTSSLEAHGLADKTVLVVLSPHGEELGEGGLWSHAMDVTDREMHVPLVLAGPGVAAGRRVTEVVELIDLGPTLLELCGIRACGAHQGVSFRSQLGADGARRGVPTDRAAFCLASGRAAARTARWHFMVDDAARVALFDVGASCSDMTNVAAEHPDVVAMLKSRVGEWFEKTWRQPRGLRVQPEGRSGRFFGRSGYWW